MLILGFAGRTDCTESAAEAVLDAATEPGMPLEGLRTALAPTPALPATEDSSAGDLAAVQAEPVVCAIDDSELEDLAHAANQEALSFGVSLDPFLRLAKTVRAKCTAPQAQPADAPIAYLQESDQHLLHRFIETTEDDESFDIGKDAVKRLANLGVVESCGFGRYGVTMFGYWVHEHHWHQNPSLPLKTNADRDREHRAAMAAAQEGGNAAKEA